MFNTEKLHESMKSARAYRALRLALYVLEAVGDNGVYVAPSAVHVRRVLASAGEDECKAVDVATAVRQLVAMGVLDEQTEGQRFVLAGGGDAE